MRTFIVIIILCLSQTIFGQSDTKSYSNNYNEDQFLVSWGLGVPLNNDYLSKISFRNVRLEYRHYIENNFAVGISLGWNSFDEKTDKQLYETEDGSNAVYTDLVRQVYLLPFTANAYYNFNNNGNIRPFMGIGLGAQFSQQEAFFNAFVIDDKNWGFLVRPEIGVQFQINSEFTILANTSYSYATNSSDFFPIDNLKHFNIGIGCGWNF
ncbi:OmpW family outer membrane protein [Maribacter sp. 1_MG-2023]|uniref:outer membrane beta-barrel protein n=1 Tax=Maribacter sp. 1_MG-2023 TaxID=3062677 RepID=UPI0026E1B0F6|nr:OmpW family outer membrane protein [Maribacter sp. 1_MG-2023]MDO6473737.1 OmpW family outer membrane protein [Maribacter sp. 1_MG-2023]